MKVELPWPSRSLSPNVRLHWSKKAAAAKKARNDARFLCMAAGLRNLSTDFLRLSVTYCPPDKRRRDLDNLVASSKALFDGIADATQVDDSKWSLTFTKGEPVKNGAVIVEIMPHEQSVAK